MITVKREGELERQTWRFRYDEYQHVLFLIGWEHETRPTTRHKLRAVASWGRYGVGNRTPRPEVPAYVLDEARAQFVATLKVEV